MKHSPKRRVFGMMRMMEGNDRIKVAVFGGGCFWCTEAVYKELNGVVSVTPGYAGGTVKNPTYESVGAGKTDHAEVVKIEYDPEKISYGDLLAVFFATHDPTTPNRQGSDIGTQYRSIILYATEDQKKEAELYLHALNASGKNAVTEVRPLGDFYEAEEYHKNYYANNASAPYCQIVIRPKLETLRTQFQKLVQSSKTMP